MLAAELTPGIIGYQDSISKASAKIPIELRAEEKLQQDELERFHQEREANKRDEYVFRLRLLALLDNENKEISDKISSIRYRGDLILICNHLEELHQLLKLKLYKKRFGFLAARDCRLPRKIKGPHLQMGTGERAELNQNKWDDVIDICIIRKFHQLQTMLNGFISNHNEQSYVFHWDMKLQAIETIFLMGPLKVCQNLHYMA
ncbi:uncharacterized protein PGTG_18782 [Puccinia graminis f. sp. tritici CRL 75-36-700-3]|uniref:Uncharacterized protein n=1 Tax=Puccinia graminis f. sp. tritici (strain CRL 75-36-700-3 / race SCCL) TaxID=418459 RepID=E3L8I9_PUCGT|nr:uncharacterized protein PGTG_18782 [Puccinia graminis f. sp. tritici CRL 75-36-700-3]EFP92864.1 hypothetical protein PGTG_18782 [Puccinia graminis f. sp. tritici CRL 75-36-700-3]